MPRSDHPHAALDLRKPEIGSLAFHRVAELLMGHMDQASAAGDFRMAAAYAQMAADAEGRAFALIPPERTRTRWVINESQLALVDRTMELEAALAALGVEVDQDTLTKATTADSAPDPSSGTSNTEHAP